MFVVSQSVFVWNIFLAGFVFILYAMIIFMTAKKVAHVVELSWMIEEGLCRFTRPTIFFFEPQGRNRDICSLSTVGSF
jgi:hypothetical protein